MPDELRKAATLRGGPAFLATPSLASLFGEHLVDAESFEFTSPPDFLSDKVTLKIRKTVPKIAASEGEAPMRDNERRNVGTTRSRASWTDHRALAAELFRQMAAVVETPEDTER